jgi:Plant transposon protein
LHVYWKNCPYAWQGSFMGKEDGPTVIVEAVSDHNLWIWHASVGYPGALNDINVFDLSSLSKTMVDGTLEANDVPFTAGDENFTKNYYLEDGIYPSIARMVKSISVPLTPQERYFRGWQEASRKDIERAFGVLVRRFMILSRPMETMKVKKIKTIMFVCILLHNMLVEERVSDDNEPYLHGLGEDENDDNGGVLEAEVLLNSEMERMAHRRAMLEECRMLNQDILDVELEMAERRSRFLSRSMQLVQKRYAALYDQDEYSRLQNALVRELHNSRL